MNPFEPLLRRAMHRREFLAILAGSAAVAVADVLYLISLYVSMTASILSMLVPSIVAVCLLAALFLPRWRIGESRSPPEETYARLLHGLRQAQHRVEEKPDHLVVRVGRWSAIKIWIGFERGGSSLRYQLDATPSGWGLIMVLVILVEVSVVAPLVILYVFAQVERFVNRKLIPITVSIGAPREIAPEPDVRSMLVDSLAEAHRLAAEAFESERASYQDSQAVVLFGGILVWGFTLLLILLGVAPSDPLRQGFLPLLVSLVTAAGVTILPAFWVRRRFRPRILEHRGWANRLQQALAEEASRRPSETGAFSVFELLADASAQVPRWIEARRRAGLSRDPASGFLLLGMAVWAFTLFEGFWVGLGFGILYAALFLTAAVLLSFGVFAFYHRWARRLKEASERSLLEWRQRLERVRALMEQYLDGL